jgi:hypothetical protein
MDELITQHPVNRQRDERPLLRRYTRNGRKHKEIRKLRKLVKKEGKTGRLNGWMDG